ncbi:hypothetical protein EHQ12_04255 [Leptospira gomenensis]|uniref:DUF2184 domain-containing protein n=1 Tax=Leptospira gomenensis TaxID=2484974 RepID=A0A5F1YH33_9LEPT|nr:hypothetical protein [Leptospira gomenensis]TGK36173.1 hypothetical protein EHQ17_04460 [Leptospira gomenensis]TGK42787.1 hypothetical protein EHQ07_14030 [Leptospira gomenensis]TGK42976.1 hypothetical protein EHQ12_04255 [Leptospira gomenensis]TGK54931.1 hypothetical protein EHQ13_18200 [Leptospira gomenensis]
MADLLIEEGEEKKFWLALQAFKDPRKDAELRIKARKDMNKLLDHFVGRPERLAKKKLQAFKGNKQKLQAFNGGTVKGDLPELFTDNVSIYVDSDAEIDLFYNAIFDQVPTTPGLDYFEIANIHSGIVWKRLVEGERVEIGGITGDAMQVKLNRFGAALGVNDDTIRYRKIWRIVDAAKEFRFAYYQLMGDNHGALLHGAAALGRSNGYYQAFSTVAGLSETENYIRLFNLGCAKVAEKLKTRPYGNMSNPSLVVLASPKKKSVISKVMNTLIQPIQGSKQALDWSINPLYTWNGKAIPDENKVKIILPGRKIQMGIESEMEEYAVTDPLTLNYALARYSWRGAGIGDTDQILELDLA